jgi:predicted 2-oxoglutarate/Fe(II)-dependent dioxygenase YbiX
MVSPKGVEVIRRSLTLLEEERRSEYAAVQGLVRQADTHRKNVDRLDREIAQLRSDIGETDATQ